MAGKHWRMDWRRTASLFLALVVLGNGGCLWIAAGAAGGAAAGYAYCRGKVCQAYNANMEDAWRATHTALAELGMPVVKEERLAAEGTIMTRTADDDRVKITFDLIDSRIPAEGPLTRIGVRVATFGDSPTSERILNQIGVHLVASPLPGPPVAPPPPGTAAPPLAPPPAPQPVTTAPSTAEPPTLLPPRPANSN